MLGNIFMLGRVRTRGKVSFSRQEVMTECCALLEVYQKVVFTPDCF